MDFKKSTVFLIIAMILRTMMGMILMTECNHSLNRDFLSIPEELSLLSLNSET